MDAQKSKARRAFRRKFRVRKNIKGTPERPRLSVHRSNLHIAVQLIDDVNGVTLASASTKDKEAALKYGGNIQGAEYVGKEIAEKAKAQGIRAAAFDRGHYRYHGRVKALAKAATVAGLVCTGLEEKVKKVPDKPVELTRSGKKKK